MDKDKIPYHLLPEDACLTEQQLYGYMDGTLSYPEQHAVEKHLLDCDFCTDALAGLELVTDRTRIAAVPPVAPVEPLTTPVAEPKKEKGRIIPFYRSGRTYAAAAALVLIVAITWFFNNTAKNESSAQLSDNATAVTAEQPAAEAKVLLQDSIAKETDEAQRFADNIPADGETNTPEKSIANKNKTAEDLNIQATAPKPVSPVAPGTNAYADQTAPATAGKKAFTSEEAKADGVDDMAYRDEAKLKKEDRRKEQLNERAGDLAVNVAPAYEGEKMDFDANYKPLADSVKVAANFSTSSSSPVTLSTANGGTTYNWSPVTADSFAKPVSTNVGMVSSSATMFSQPQSLSTEVVVTSTRSDKKLELFKDNSAKKSKATSAPAVSGESQKTAPLSDNDKYNRALTEINANRNESALLILNDILTNTASPLYADAQWQKAVVLIKLNKKAEAKTILQDIVKKGGKYKPLAESQLKQF
jgi:hypothetical protein